MKCQSCGAEGKGRFCEFCGSELPKEKQNINITNNYYGNTTTQGNGGSDLGGGKCPKCGGARVSFKRERVSTSSQSNSWKNFFGTGKKRTSTSQASYRTVGVCQNCGYTWVPNVECSPKEKSNYTWLWVLGWICIFPLPLTILLLRRKEMKPAVKYGIIAAAWALFLIIGLTGNAGTSETDQNSGSDEAVIEEMDFWPDGDITVKVGETYSSGRLKVEVKRKAEFFPEDVVFVSANPEVATIDFDHQALSHYLYFNVVGVTAGETEIYATSKDGNIESERIKVIVPEPIVVEELIVAVDDTELCLGEEVTSTVSILPENAENKTVIWSSSDESIAIVDDKGEVSAIGGGTATITVSSANGVSSSFDVTVDGTKRLMKVSQSRDRQDDNNIGDSWNYDTEINGEYIPQTHIVAVGDVLTFRARFTEEDDNPDVGEAKVTHTVTEEDLENGFTLTVEVYVRENGGKNSGKRAYFIVTTTFEP